jgi:hypothetical protein
MRRVFADVLERVTVPGANWTVPPGRTAPSAARMLTRSAAGSPVGGATYTVSASRGSRRPPERGRRYRPVARTRLEPARGDAPEVSANDLLLHVVGS